MPYDGSTWDEANPTNGTLANEIDDNMRDIKVGVSGRMRQEHIWPTSQASTAEGGYHTYISFQAQTGNPTVPVVASATQAGILFVTAGMLTFRNSAGSNVTLVNSGGTGLNLVGGVYSTTGTLGEMIIGTVGGTIRLLAPGTSGQVLTATTGGAGVVWSSAVGFGSFAARSFATTYQATSDGFVVGNTVATSASHSYTAYQDGGASPSTVIQLGSALWVSGGQAIDIPISFPVKKNNYYSVVGSGCSGTMQFIPLGA